MSYMSGMTKSQAMLGVAAAVLFAFGAASTTADASSRALDQRYSIMAPELGIPRYQSPRGIPQEPSRIRPRVERPVRAPIKRPAPPIILPNGQVVPNLPPVSRGYVPSGGRETFGDRAARCAHQSALFGVPADQRGTYLHSCTTR
jgi:hypothetical protein